MCEHVLLFKQIINEMRDMMWQATRKTRIDPVTKPESVTYYSTYIAYQNTIFRIFFRKKQLCCLTSLPT